MTTTTMTTKRLNKADRGRLAEDAVAAYRAMGPRHVVEAIEMRAERSLTAGELTTIRRAVEAEFPGMDWDAPSRELAGKFPMA